MKTALLFTLLLTSTAFAAPIEITCGNLKAGNAVTLSISPLQRTVAYTSYKDGIAKASYEYGPTNGIYDTNNMSFSGGDFLEKRIYIHASYAEYLRINHFSAISIALEKQVGEATYTLTTLSSGYVTTSGSQEELKEKPHTDLIDLSCSIDGL